MVEASDAVHRALDLAVADFARVTGFPLAFGGFEADGVTNITSLVGNRTRSLHGLGVAKGLGLGGRAMFEGRPRLTADYSRSRHITHDYDHQVMAEHVTALFAMPVMLNGKVRALLYGGTRGGGSPGSAFVQAGASIASTLAEELRIEDEVTRRVAARCTPQEAKLNAMQEGLRAGHAELRRIAASVADTEIRDQILAFERSFARLGTAGPVDSNLNLTPRELDVVSYAGLGATNVEIARNLSLTESTVKSYLKSAMTKLRASTRHAAVASARRHGLIP